MALIQCPECGSLISDTAKNCPRCGFKLQSKSFEKIIFGFILVAIGLFIAVMGMCWMTNFSKNTIIIDEGEYFWQGLVINIIALLPIYFGSKMLRGLYKRYMLIFVSLVCLVVAANAILMLSLGVSTYKAHYNIEYSGIESEKAKQKNTTPEYVGTYEYQQHDNSPSDKTLRFIINADNTCSAISINERFDDETFYGSWSKVNINGTPAIIMHFEDTQNGYVSGKLRAWTDWGEALNMTDATLYDGFLYANEAYARSKNPERRIKVDKIE